MRLDQDYGIDGKWQKFFELMKRFNVKSFKYGELVVHFNSDTKANEQSSTLIPIDLTGGMPPDDLMVYAATDEFDRMLAERKAAIEPEQSGE